MPVDNSHIYKSLVERLSKKCRQLQTWNEQHVHRINKVKVMMRYQKRDVTLLKKRLDKFGDNWRAIPMMIAPHPKRKIEQKRGPKPKVKSPTLQQKQPITNATTPERPAQLQLGLSNHQQLNPAFPNTNIDWPQLTEQRSMNRLNTSI